MIRRLLPGLLSGYFLLWIPACQAQTTPRPTANESDRTAPAPPAATAVQPKYTPLTEEGRAVQYLKDLASPIAFVASGASAGIGQWRDRPKQWGQGHVGYEYRYASSFAEHIVKSTLEYGASGIFQDDNRYLASGLPGKGGRIEYALESTILARRGDGTRKLSVSKIIAFAGAAAISRFWQPRGTRTVKSGVANFGVTVSVSAGLNVVREFWPRKQ